MRNLNKIKTIGISIFSILFVLIIILAFVTYQTAHFVFQNPLLAFAVTNHLWIMVAMVVFSVLFGFFWSKMLYKEIETEKITSKNVMNVVLSFLSREERKILNHIVEQNGSTTQAEVTRLQGMNKVKAFRSLKKMNEKDILSITPHGKVRKIKLRQELYEILKN